MKKTIAMWVVVALCAVKFFYHDSLVRWWDARASRIVELKAKDERIAELERRLSVAEAALTRIVVPERSTVWVTNFVAPPVRIVARPYNPTNAIAYFYNQGLTMTNIVVAR